MSNTPNSGSIWGIYNQAPEAGMQNGPIPASTPGPNNTPAAGTAQGFTPLNYSPTPGATSEGFYGSDYGPLPEWGGEGGAANATAANLFQQGQVFAGRTAPDLNTFGGPYVTGGAADINADRQWNQAVHDTETPQLSVFANEANGGGPSAATIQGRQAMDQNFGNSFGALRGGNVTGAINQQGTGGLGVANTLGEARAGEIANASNNYLGAASNLTSQDLQQQQLEQQYGAAQARNDLQQTTANDKAESQYQAMANQTLADELQAETAAYGTQWSNASAANIQNIQNQAAFTNNLVGMGVQGATGAFTAYGQAQDAEQPQLSEATQVWNGA